MKQETDALLYSALRCKVKNEAVKQVLKQGPDRKPEQKQCNKRSGGNADGKTFPDRKKNDGCIDRQHRHGRDLAQSFQQVVVKQPDIALLRGHMFRYSFCSRCVHDVLYLATFDLRAVLSPILAFVSQPKKAVIQVNGSIDRYTSLRTCLFDWTIMHKK